MLEVLETYNLDTGGVVVLCTVAQDSEGFFLPESFRVSWHDEHTTRVGLVTSVERFERHPVEDPLVLREGLGLVMPLHSRDEFRPGVLISLR